MYKLGFEEVEEGNLKQIRLPTFFGSWRRKGVPEKKTCTSVSLTMPKP